MMHSACSPAAAPRDCRTGVQSTLGQPARGQNVLAVRAAKARTVNFLGNDEPSLDELMEDDLVRRVMARDGLQPHQVWSLMDDMRVRLR